MSCLHRHPLRVVCVLSNSFSLSKLSWTILFTLYYVHYSIRKAQPTAYCSFTSQPCSVLFSSSTLPTFMVTKKVFGLYSKLVKRSVWQNFLLSRIYDTEVFQKSFSIHSLQNFVVDNQMSKYSAEKTSPLTFFFVLTFSELFHGW